MNDLSLTPAENMLLAISQGDLATAEVEGLKTPQVDAPVFHFFSPGLCVREVHLPAGSIIIGHVQKFAHLNVFLKGRLRMIHPDGGVQDLVAPMMFTGTPGRKVCYVVEDSIWQNIYPTESVDPAEVEATFIDKSQAFQANAQERLLAAACLKQEDRDDHASLPPTIRDFFQDLRHDPSVQLPGLSGIMRNASPIHGIGVFSTSKWKCNQHIAPLSVDNRWTAVAADLNHSKSPNCMVVDVGGQLWLMAIREIQGCLGGQPGDELTVDYRQFAIKGELT